MYESDDPRSRLSSTGSAPPPVTRAAPGGGAFSASSYARFYAEAPQVAEGGAKSWYARGANFVVAWSEVEPGTRLDRTGQDDEYVLLIPDAETRAVVTAGNDRQDIPGFTITMIPPGDSSVEITTGGRIVRLFSARTADIAALASNADAYAEPPAHIPPFEYWPDPEGGFRIRSYSLDVPDEEGRFGKIWRSTNFMVNVFQPQIGPRDPAKLSPHHHDDFEQCSLCIGGTYVHHLRWPWTANLADWRDDEHETCGTPSICVIPARVIHTSAAVDPGVNLLVDIFSPPRTDFSNMPGWVLNAADYPMPE
ncbi:hypothetical protein ACFQ1E_06255 [Sphingomonas canadensis]|uniref:Phytanoyl-CoA dioxygenase n=1 Tax=Sphingomonas canadensis TaxID=1219257 RepID=A0ABW3H8G5_9SPHN|nr:hypothetical protein [Sphingomonas canadensis]MCW3835607.1 hypothetical protein [Sphingomonas canadensis]